MGATIKKSKYGTAKESKQEKPTAAKQAQMGAIDDTKNQPKDKPTPTPTNPVDDSKKNAVVTPLPEDKKATEPTQEKPTPANTSVATNPNPSGTDAKTAATQTDNAIKTDIQPPVFVPVIASGANNLIEQPETTENSQPKDNPTPSVTNISIDMKNNNKTWLYIAIAVVVLLLIVGVIIYIRRAK